MDKSDLVKQINVVLISFREWLHSYKSYFSNWLMNWKQSSHLFQRVASFLQVLRIQGWCWNGTSVLISFREWLHSYKFYGFKVDVGMAPVFSSLSESGFIPTTWNVFWRRNQVLSVLISFREWLHSYTYLTRLSHSWTDWGSHLFQRVASFLLL